MMQWTILDKTAALLTSAVLAVLGLSVAAPASARQGVVAECSRGGLLTFELQRDGRQWEADIQINAGPSEKWTVTISQKGRVVHTVTKTTNREGEFDFWRYLPGRSGTIDVRATASTGETCSAKLRA